MSVKRWAMIVPLLVLTACGSAGPSVGTPDTVSAAAPTAPATATGVPTAAPATPSLVPTVVAEASPTLAPTSSPTEMPSPTATASPAETQSPAATETEPPTVAPAETSTKAGGVAVRPDLPGKLAFTRGSDLWLYVPRTGEVRELIAGTTDARWSPDGRSIAFARAGGIYLADEEGRNERLIHEAARANTPVWSPDGTRLAFEIGGLADEPATREVWVYDRGESEARKVAAGMDPAWAPDSKRIAYVTAPAGDAIRRNQLRLVSWRGENDWAVVKDLPPDLPQIGVPGSEVERNGLEHVMTTPVWDSEGRYIYVPSFLIYQVLTDFFIWERADAVNGGSTFVEELPGGDATPSPNNEAALIGATSARGDTWFVARALGGTTGDWSWAETPKGITALAPAWAPDAQAVAYYHCDLEQRDQCELRLLAPDGGTTLLPEVFEGVAPDYARPLSLTWGRDG